MNTIKLFNVQKGRLISKYVIWLGLALMLLNKFKVLEHETWEIAGFSMVILGGLYIILYNTKLANKKLAIIGLSGLVAITLIVVYIMYFSNK
ncbi:hypothetical protein [Membranihabitans marinus]|uniref:hypothetical protein n=1 Tax=Membranihabitans marinus TaxID=1227546 RepID=UPI001F2B776E|nr:hypothetical protein [Membranihabitans marinus]